MENSRLILVIFLMLEMGQRVPLKPVSHCISKNLDAESSQWYDLVGKRCKFFTASFVKKCRADAAERGYFMRYEIKGGRRKAALLPVGQILRGLAAHHTISSPII